MEIRSLLPSAFVWTKMGAESGEALDAIIQRKDYERWMGDGLFSWGIGSALGSAVAALVAETPNPKVVFSPMPSKPKKEDAAPSTVLLWTAYEDARGVAHPLPAHVVITSRGNAGKSDKARHYSLFCRSEDSLCNRPDNGLSVAPTALRNFSTGYALGASQVTAVVRHVGGDVTPTRRYPVAFTANLAGAMYARLLAPRFLSAIDLDDMAAATDGGMKSWQRFVDWIRRPVNVIGFEVPEQGRESGGPSLGTSHRNGAY